MSRRFGRFRLFLVQSDRHGRLCRRWRVLGDSNGGTKAARGDSHNLGFFQHGSEVFGAGGWDVRRHLSSASTAWTQRRNEAALDSGHIPPVNAGADSRLPVKSLRFRLLLLALFLAVFPFFLRRRPRVERRITILAPPASIFPFLNDLRNWPLWTAWSGRDDIQVAYGPTTSGAGAEQRWENCHMSGVMRILKSDADERIDYEVEINGGAHLVIGRIELHSDGACTRLVWKCAWDRAENPYWRYVDLFMRWMIRRDFGQGLANLKALIESGEKPPQIQA